MQNYDLITPDAFINKIKKINDNTSEVTVSIKKIPPNFIGFNLTPSNIVFNLKSTLAQLGMHSKTKDLYLSKKDKEAEVTLQLQAYGAVAKALLNLLSPGAFVGKLFAIDISRKVRKPQYLKRMFGRCDRNGSPLLSFGNPSGRDDLILEEQNGYTIAYVPLERGCVKYKKGIFDFLPTLSLMLHSKKFQVRESLKLYQAFNQQLPMKTEKNEILLVKTKPLHIRSVFARVAPELLPVGFTHTSADILQPDTAYSGDIYELFGISNQEITEIPLEFYTLEPHKEHVFFEDRDQLQSYLEDSNMLFKAFNSISTQDLASVFVVKGTQMANLSEKDWEIKKPKKPFPKQTHPSRQSLLVEKYLTEQPSYPFLKAIENDYITSQGVLLTKYLPSPLIKQMLLSNYVKRCVKAIYFQKPSYSYGVYFSNEDRSFLLDLAKFGIPIFWVDETSKNVLKYVIRPEKEAGMFVPKDLIEDFTKATFWGVYGSNLKEDNFCDELKKLLKAILSLKNNISHPLLNKDSKIALVTGGGPGVMESSNKIAKELNVLSCANIVDFNNPMLNEQKINPYIEAKMTYRLDRLVERQAEFHLDFPICFQGGMGMDFEFNLEQITRKTGVISPTPILLFGSPDYWKQKISSNFTCNINTGTIKGSEWVSNCFYCIQTAEQGLDIYKKFFNNMLSIGPKGKIYKDGFCITQNP